jgi:peptide/nickel transport system substrate-binding protein
MKDNMDTVDPQETNSPLSTSDMTQSPSSQPAMATGGTDAPLQPIFSPEPKHRGVPISLPILAIILLVLVGGGLAVWKWGLKSDAPKTTTTVKSIPVLHVGSYDGPLGNENVFPAAAQAEGSSDVDFQVFEGLVGYEDQKIVPLLATSWTNPNNTTWEFKIAKNVHFQNGTLLTPELVVSSIKADMQNEGWNQYLQTVKSVATSGSDSVTFTTDQPDALFLNKLIYSFIFTQDASKKYYGTGPYTIDASKSSDTGMYLNAFNGYHGGIPKAHALEYSIHDTSEEMNKEFQAGRVDCYIAGIGSNSTAKQTSTSFTVPGAYDMLLNIKRPNGVMSNKLVREALAYAIDREALAKQSSNGTTPAYQLIPKEVVGYDAQANFPKQDLAKSKQLQTQAGYPNGAPINFLYIEGLQDDAPVLIQQLTTAGFKVTAQPVSSPKDLLAISDKGTYDLLTATVSSNYNDGTDVFTDLLSSTGSVFSQYSNPDFDKLLAVASQTLDPATHIQKTQVVNRYIADNYLVVPVRSTQEAFYSRQGYQALQNFTYNTQSAAYWRVGQVVTSKTK